MERGVGRRQPTLGARVVARTPLLYAAGPDPRVDRPAHVRAGSALVSLEPGVLGVVQDDASFLAIVTLSPHRVDAVAFPASDGVRQFDDGRGNKKAKLDVEAAIVVDDRDGPVIAFGSGSSPRRERVVVVRAVRRGPDVRIVDAHALYTQMRALLGPRCELNVEGAVVRAREVVFFQRGNGAGESFDATLSVEADALFAWLGGGAPEGECPRVRALARWELGAIDGVRLSFTDATRDPCGRIAFLACAEDSPDATRDGPVTAVAIGRLDEGAGVAELAPILDERGAPLLAKTEGLAFDGGRAFAVVDADDPDAPAALLELALDAGWSA